MRTIATVTALGALFLAACSVEQQNGNDIRLEQPFVLSDQSWHVSEQARAPEAFCTVSAGELSVTQRLRGHAIVTQVGTNNKLSPGDSYKVLAGGHNYESAQQWFSPQESRAIVSDLMANAVIYTETRRITLGAGPYYRSIDNKIPMDGFAKQYRGCEAFLKSR